MTTCERSCLTATSTPSTDRLPPIQPVSPDEAHMFLGELYDTVPGVLQRIGQPAVLIHFDVGSGDEEANAELARWMTVATADLLAPGGVAVADQALVGTSWRPIDLPEGVSVGRYFMYQCAAP